MVRAEEFTRRRSTVWFSTGTPWSTSRSQASCASGVHSLGWLKCVTTKSGFTSRRSRASASVTRIGQVTGARVASRRICTCGMARSARSTQPRRSSESARGSPPETSTSRTAGWART